MMTITMQSEQQRTGEPTNRSLGRNNSSPACPEKGNVPSQETSGRSSPSRRVTRDEHGGAAQLTGSTNGHSHGSDHPKTRRRASPTLTKRKGSSSATTLSELGDKLSSVPRPGYTSRSSSSSALQRMAIKLGKQTDRLKSEFEGWRRHIIKSPRADESVGPGRPMLLSVEPIVSAGTDNCYKTSVKYRARLRLTTSNGQHEWATEPFSMDELLAVVVNSRKAYACKGWCSTREAPPTIATFSNKSDEAVGVEPRRDLRIRAWFRRKACCMALWASLLLITYVVARTLRPLVESALLPQWPETWGDLPRNADWFAAVALSVMSLSFCAGLLAGVTETSFLPAKVILHLERKAETAQVREQLALLLKSADCLLSLDVCNFLNLGSATYYGSSETKKEGRVLCRRHESAEVYFAQTRRRRCSFFCFSFDWNCRFRGGGARKGFTERWLVLRKDGLALFSTILDEDPTDMLFFDTSFSLFRDAEDRVCVCGTSWVLELDFGGDSSGSRVAAWCNAITLTAQLSPRTREQRFGSFAPIRYPAQSKPGDRHMLRRTMARFLIGGRATFRKIAEAILVAQHEIFVLGWFVSPHLPLVREGEPLPGAPDGRLSTMLKSAADRGVRVCVLIFHETYPSLPNDSEWAEKELRHPNLYVMRHRSRFDANRLWSHHEKVVVVDQQLAFVGGLDLALGRYDDAKHRLKDDTAPQVWQGQDYSNPRTKDFCDVRNVGHKDILDRARQPRTPWQDVQCMLMGKPARDVARHCIERWNYSKSKRPQYYSYPTALIRRKVAVCNDRMLEIAAESGDGLWPRECGDWHSVTAQVVRSCGRWSAGTGTESSIHAAYCNLIQEAERFVYIENQFLCSGMDGDDAIGNRVIEAIYLRVLRAHSHQEHFHVMILLPLLPALDGPITATVTTPLLQVMRWQYRTIRGLRQRLTEAGVDMKQYISVYSLRTHDVLAEAGPVTEQIYIHSKVMVVDDRWAIVGSANLNDRSLLGLRDSEVCVVLKDSDTEEVMLGGPWQSGAFATNFRRALFAQHLGWSQEDMEGRFADLLNNDTLETIRSVARRNTEIYEELFGALPSDNVRTWADLSARRAAPSSAVGTRPWLLSDSGSGDMTRSPDPAYAREVLSEVRGNLVEFPLDFLVDEDLTPPPFSVGALTPDAFN